MAANTTVLHQTYVMRKSHFQLHDTGVSSVNPLRSGLHSVIACCVCAAEAFQSFSGGAHAGRQAGQSWKSNEMSSTRVTPEQAVTH